MNRSLTVFSILFFGFLITIVNFSMNSFGSNETPTPAASFYGRRLAEKKLIRGAEKEFDVTMISQTSSDRLFYLKYIKERWIGNIAIAVYCPEEKRQMIEETLSLLQLPSRVKIILHIPKDPKIYPINLLRNIAIEGIETSHFWVADMDMWPNWDLYQTLSGLPRKFLADDSLAVIVPSFSYKSYYSINGCLSVLTCALLIKDEFPATKSELTHCVNTGNCAPFRNESYTHAYHFPGWHTLPATTSLTYKTPSLPYFDSRFINYGFNKVQWIETLRYSGYKFAVLSQSYAIDIPHPDSHFAIDWRSQWSLGKVAMKDLYDEYIQKLRNTTDHSVVYICPPAPDARIY
ncbi:hypothetical protein WA158_001155 [Blastocystis sp. Blastoise]